MNQYKKSAMCLFTSLILLLFPRSLPAGGDGQVSVSGSATVDYVGNYVTRGMKWDGSCIQPCLDLGCGTGPWSVNGGLWASYDVEGGGTDEVDPYVGVSCAVGKVLSLSASYCLWHYLGGSDEDVYFVGVDMDAPLNPGFGIQYNATAETYQPSFALSHSLALCRWLSADGGAALGYYMKGDFAQGYVYYELFLGLTGELPEAGSLSAGVTLTGNRASGGDPGGDEALNGDNYLFFTTSYSLSF